MTVDEDGEETEEMLTTVTSQYDRTTREIARQYPSEYIGAFACERTPAGYLGVTRVKDDYVPGLSEKARGVLWLSDELLHLSQDYKVPL